MAAVLFLVFPRVRKGCGLSDPQVAFLLPWLNQEKDPLLPNSGLPPSLVVAEDPPVL